MANNEQLIRTFYQSFQNRDYRAMQYCYADDAIFSDAIFKNLDSKQVKAMWEMLIKRGKNFSLTFDNIKAGENAGSADWIATYKFSATNRKVINLVRANFIFENNKIIRHTDDFDFYKWSRQALGLPALLLGWTPFFKSKVRRSALKGLEAYMKLEK
ncbi:MAG TPA: nuclear transport factor 2 family protein [Hanamia sp.]|nr:nuclear transport factor 2 family protein [Hanamia sp.]